MTASLHTERTSWRRHRYATDEDREWQEDARCAETDPEAFFPEKGGSISIAKRICAMCEVRAECLEYALLHGERHGVWGGMSERERRDLMPGVAFLFDGPETDSEPESDTVAVVVTEDGPSLSVIPLDDLADIPDDVLREMMAEAS